MLIGYLDYIKKKKKTATAGAYRSPGSGVHPEI